ncbi:DUF3788 domain-containing protein [Acetanaerobacterium elongatum]|uniref:DUF3788 domain-containing protein n=1 Tax=Acetanaerobacterium elongatum TaxID=258515 RepID=A0A1G9U4U0_9FIRM|nr:DUF3788 domain-containing protein [Acetanaerobacterium elongatum]SDM54956.1 Protein of unknown function [Acetanaerobacterium elongatum]
MEWSSLYGPEYTPTFEEIRSYINNPLWQELNDYLQAAYIVQPKLSYSKCSMQRGWNVKYQKSGRALCTLYPTEGFFIALVVIGEREQTQAELLLPLCCAYTQGLYNQAACTMGQRWLMLAVTDSKVLQDVKQLLQLRVAPKVPHKY